MIDTGASGTVVHAESIKALSVPPTGVTNIHTPSTAGASMPCYTYDLGLAVIDHGVNFLIGSRRVIATDLTGNNIEALIGCDVLASCLLVYDGVNQTFTLAF